MGKKANDVEICESCEVHENLLKIVNETIPAETELYDLAELFKIFGDSTRIRILYVLFEAEVCVCDLAEALNMTQSAISHQLRILKQNKLVKSRREGKSVFYSLADDHVRTIIDQGREHILDISRGSPGGLLLLTYQGSRWYTREHRCREAKYEEPITLSDIRM